MPALTTTPPDALTVAVLPAGAARLAAEDLSQSVRDAKDFGEPDTAARLELAAEAMHRAGWADQGARLEAAHAYGDAHEDVEGVTLHAFPVVLADALLTARGWTVEDVPGGQAYVMPGRKMRADGGQHGRDFLWHRDEALRLALMAEALEQGA